LSHDLNLDTPDGPLTADTVLQDRYRIVRQLGRGGMGAVYEAVDQRLGKTLAIKETLSSEASMRKQFEREARLLAVMHHPALPKVTDHFVEGNRAFLVMEFIGGHDLAKIIAQQPGPFPRDQVIAWADQLLDALIYLHTRDRQVIHRDIKPHNLKLTATGQIALLDFGLAKAQHSDPSVTSSQAFFGYTRHYAPLEQIQDQRTDPRSDIYALGATLYHLLTGIKPPDAMVRAAAVVNADTDPLLPANQIHPAVGPQIAAILNKAMAQKAEDRYTDAHEFREALRRMGRTQAVGVELEVEKAGQGQRINVNGRESELPVAEVRAISKANFSSEPHASEKPPAYAGGSDRRSASVSHSDKRIANASGTDIFVEPPDMQMALVASARRFGPAGVTIVLAAIFAIAGGILYGSQRWFPSTEAATESLSVAPNAAALRVPGSARKQDRTHAADNAVTANTKTVNVTVAPMDSVPENMNTSGVNGVTKSQSEKRSVVEATKSPAEKKTGMVTKPISGTGPDAPRSAPRKEPHRVGAPSIRFPQVEFRDNGDDNPTPPSSDSSARSDASSSNAPKPKPNSNGGPKFFRAADGTQIVKFPDGSTQFIRPGQRSAAGSYR
jgi:serine/threonine protein kinase